MEKDKGTTFLAIILTGAPLLVTVSMYNSYSIETIITQAVIFLFAMYFANKKVNDLIVFNEKNEERRSEAYKKKYKENNIHVQDSARAAARDYHETNNYYNLDKKEGIYSPHIEIQNIPAFLKDLATIRIINNEPIKDLHELRVELKRLHAIVYGVKSPNAHELNPSYCGFDCGDGKIPYGGAAKDVHLANNNTHNLTFLTSENIQPQLYYSDGKRDEISYEIEIWIHGRLDGNPIAPPIQFCGRIDFWRAEQVVQLAHDVSKEQQVSQLEMTEINCENQLRWLMS